MSNTETPMEVQLTERQARALQLGCRSAEIAGAAAREMGYTPTREQFRTICYVLRRAVEAGLAALSDEEVAGLEVDALDDETRAMALEVLRGVLGPAPMAS